MIRLPELSVYISHTCTLSCDSCCTFNHLNWGNHFKIDKHRERLERLKGIVDFEEVFIIGGEPTSNPALGSWMEWIEGMWPNSKKWVVTNGRDLNKFDELYPKWQERDWKIEISAHSKEDLNTVMDWINQRWENVTCEKFWDGRHEDGEWHYKLEVDGIERGEITEAWQFYENPSVLKNANKLSWDKLRDAQDQHSKCPAIQCMYLMDGRFYRCHQQAILPQLSKKFQIDDQFSHIAKQDLGCAPEEFETWIKTRLEPQIQCQLCKWENKITLPEQSKTKKIKILKL